MDSSQLIPADRPGPTVAHWQVNAGTDDLILEIFQEAPIESGLLEVIVLSVVVLRSGCSLGDYPSDLYPPHFPAMTCCGFHNFNLPPQAERHV